MTILVDEARWPWRGTKWCHLVTDHDLGELHAFAAKLGARRVGFQGDHYDIDIDTREVAIALGAMPCQSRELIRRMRSAGLRLRPSAFTKWELVQRSDEVSDTEDAAIGAEQSRGDGPDEPVELISDPVLSSMVGHMDGWFVLSRVRDTGERANAAVVLGAGLDPAVSLPPEDPSSGLFSRVDHLGNWSVERISPPPTNAE